jgi:hypothetical protein
MRTRKLILGIIVCVLIPVAVSAKKVSIADAIKKKMITATAKGLGGHSGTVIEMVLKSNTNEPLEIEIEPGRKFHPEDPGMQDILVSRSQLIPLKPMASQTIRVSGFCCIAGNSSPSLGTKFRVGNMADSNLIKLARYINANKLWDYHEAQDAVWIFSDDHKVNSVDVTDSKANGLLDFVCKLKNVKKPEYTIEYEEIPNVPYSGKGITVKGFFKCNITQPNGKLVMAIYDAAGKELSADEMNAPPKTGVFDMEFQFSIKNYPPGKYFGRVIIEGKTMGEVVMEI